VLHIRRPLRHAAIHCGGALAALSFTALALAAQATVVTPEELAARRTDPHVLILHVSMESDFREARIPGARELPYAVLVEQRDGLRSELPAALALRERFEQLGVSDRTTVVVYAHEAPMATRALFTLAYLGHERLAYLDGGLMRWRAEGRATESGSPDAMRVQRGRMTGATRPELVTPAEWLLPRLGDASVALLDTRTTGEYVGRGNRSGMPSAGHLAGAHQLEWQELFEDRALRLKPRATLEALYRERVGSAQQVVTYCWVGYRASATWFIARVLGYDARMYDGSYQDWSQRGLPTRAGAEP
jgi:thiosulfate/3-mercaptopyruvate sulfurtransferase